MTVLPLLLALLSPGPLPQTALVRVAVVTNASGEGEDLADRRQSVEDLVTALSSKSKKKVMTLVPDNGAEPVEADIVIEVVGRGVTTPRFVMGLPSRPGQPGSPVGPVRTPQIKVRVTFANGDDPVELVNKNKPTLSPSGWKGAAENLADQIEKLISRQ